MLAVEETEFMPPKPTTAVKPGLCQLIDISHHSSLTKLLCITAFILRFVCNCRKPKNFTGPITPAELTQVNLLWVKEIQQEVFIKEIDDIKSCTTSPQANRLPLVCQL